MLTHPTGQGPDTLNIYPNTEQMDFSFPSRETVGFIHIYGNLAKGTYWINACQIVNYELLSTDKALSCFKSVKICQSLQLYMMQVGPLTGVVLALILWNIVQPVPLSFLIISMDDEKAIG